MTDPIADPVIKGVLKEDQVFRCTCEGRCSKRLEGFRDIRWKAYKSHQAEEEQLRWRRERDMEWQNRHTDEEVEQVQDPGTDGFDTPTGTSASHEPRPVLPNSPPTSELRAQFWPRPRSQTGSHSRSCSRSRSPDHLRSERRIPPIAVSSGSNSPIGSPSRSLRSPFHTPSPAPDQRPHSPLSDLNIELGDNETSEMFERPRFVDEHPSIRLLYLKIANQNINHHTTVRACNEDLEVSLESLWLAGLERPMQPKPVRTLVGVRGRLGLEVDSFLRQQPVCSECYQRFSFEEIEAAEVDKCFHPGCPGKFWCMDSGKCKPVKRIVYMRLVASLRRLFLRPDFVEALQAGQEAHREHGASSTTIMHDVCDGSAWTKALLGLERVWRADGRCVDRPAAGQTGDPQKVVSLGYGLLAAVNIDWFGMMEKYSVGAVYICFLNLHCSLQHRPENTILACIIPGPGEPHLEQLNQILDPIVEEFKVLYAGVAMKT